MAVVAAVAVGAVVLTHAAAPVDSRPITMPAFVNGAPLTRDQSADSGMPGLLRRIFGTRRATSVIYGGPSSPSQVYIVIAGRGPITRLRDVKLATDGRQTFGDVTCGGMVYSGTVLNDVCWYSSPTLGVSINFLRGTGEKATDAAVVAGLVAVLRDVPKI